MPEHPLKPIENLDPQLFNLVQQTRQLVFSDGALPRKFKFLIAMAFDAAHGKIEGTKSLATSAMEAGATKQEIAEVLRVTHYSAGVGCLHTAARALKELP
ncbi:MAG: carboxymuconolactone decarboxylase family protein [Dehalococcoidia bacterium]|nr:carboxymuconolactone decarboxylase family protein [Dehalococcoidia bacterium]